MTEKKRSRLFPLKTVLVVMKANELGRRGVERTGVTEDHGKELLAHMYPETPLPHRSQMGRYLRNTFAPLLSEQFPRLAAADVAKVTQTNFDDWMDVQETELGSEVEVPVMGKIR